MIPARTSEIQAGFGLNLLTVEEVVRWAVDAIVSGNDSKSLRILAGLEQPFDSEEIKRLLSSTWRELGISELATDFYVIVYVRSILQEMLADQLTRREALARLLKLCIDRDYDGQLMDFYNLAYAKSDLDSDGNQFYWKGANLSNIDSIIDQHAKEWLKQHDV